MDLAALRSWVRTQTLVSTAEVADATVDSYINQGYLDMASRFNWPFLYDTQTVELADGTSSYAVPNNMMVLDDVVYVGVGPTKLARTTIQAVKAEFGDQVGDSDLPDRFYINELDNNKLQTVTFVPTPNATQIVRFNYYRDPTLLAQPTDVPEFHAAFHIALADFAIHLVWMREEEPERASAALGQYLETVDRAAGFYAVRFPDEPFVVGGGPNQGRLRLLDNYLAR